MKVIFDFDDVIFNTKEFKKAMFRQFEENGYHDVPRIYDEVRQNGDTFSLRKFIQTVDTACVGSKQDTLYKDILENARDLTNKEVVEVIRHLGKNNCYIVTQGSQEDQMNKIRKTIGEDSVKNIFVVEGSKKDIVISLCNKHQDEKVVFVDDKKKFIEDIPFGICSNLKTVLFDETGLEKLQQEITMNG